MAKSRFAQTEILSILQKARDGTSITDLCCDNRISGATFYQWRRKFGSKNITEVTPYNLPHEIAENAQSQPTPPQ